MVLIQCKKNVENMEEETANTTAVVEITFSNQKWKKFWTIYLTKYLQYCTLSIRFLLRVWIGLRTSNPGSCEMETFVFLELRKSFKLIRGLEVSKL